MKNTRQLTILTVVGIVAILAAGFMFLVKPKRDDAAAIRTDVASQQSANETLQNQIRMLSEQAKQLPKVQARLAQIQKQLPNNPALPSMIRALTAAAEDAGVVLVSLQPAQPVMVAAPAAAPVTPVASASAAPGGASATAVTPAAPVPTLAAVPVRISVKGGYFQLEQFFSNIEGLSRAYLVEAFGIRPEGAAGPAESAGTLATDISGKVFMAVPPAAAAPAVQQPAAPVSN